jgi:hypothetical protein
MAKPRSLTIAMELTTVLREHGCKHNQSHRLRKGDKRLTVGEDDHHYCLACAEKFIRIDLNVLNTLLAQVQSAMPSTSESSAASRKARPRASHSG